MINSISKQKIPKDRCFALKTNQLNDILDKNNIAIHTDLIYFLGKSPGAILYAYYWLPNNYIPYNRLYIQSGTVYKEDIQIAKNVINDTVLPEFENWLKHVFSLPDNSTVFNETPTFDATLTEGKIEIKRYPL